MVIKLVTYIFLLSSTINCSDVNLVDYYVNLIEYEIARTQTFNLQLDSSAYKPRSEDVTVFGDYDYIVVGAGSAGSVIANRLTEDDDIKVLLLEAGGDESDFTDIPSMNIYSMSLEYNWNYNTTPQRTACLGMFNRECAYPTGKGLGGTSIINALMYVRGNKIDYDNWYLQGNFGWSYKDVLPYFIKSENSMVNGDDGFHGFGGYLNVEYHEPSSPELLAFIEANKILGREVLDYNGKNQLGVAKTQHNTKNGKRHSAGRAFLDPVRKRSNLKVLTHSFVIKVLIDGSKTSRGVFFTNKGRLYYAAADKEVVLSAGAINSPHILMLSGVGPRFHLYNKRIPLIHHLPVGDNLKDHATYFSLQFVTNYTEPPKTLEQNVKNFLKSYGALTIPGNSQGLGFFQTKLAEIPGYPDIELIINPSNSTNNFAQRVYHYNDHVNNVITRPINPSQTFSIYVMLLHPKSKGTVRLKSNNPFQYPLIDPNFLSDFGNEDIETMYQGIELALEIVNTEPFRKINATLMYAPLPACEKYTYLSRSYWYCQLRQLTTHIYHPIGTCKMGPDPKTGAVVDHELKVHGIKNLRVADASIIPQPTSGHTNAAAIMIGEKASDLIKKSHSHY
ncbi:hypothetical protein RN001_004162 [Aquatica leii]|uniref:Glucose-methanol-choline oxidoreductase N-terminal domain-containing protein n=1 Tax=Aquatica leii TaxID=1421715 RepID=A0AAN7PPT6_9COLE|nr:hypothetical protein RN001_004162 [Aquatica leii]